MKIRSGLRLALLFAVKAFVGVFVLAVPVFATTVGISTKAPHAVVFELESKSILFEHDIDAPTPPASISKLMALYIVFKHLKAKSVHLDDMFPVSDSAHSSGAPSAFLKVGQSVTIRDLIRGAIVASGNDACIALAEGIYGSKERFVEEMNAVAKELNLNNSHFSNVTGWPDLNSMSVRDMVTLSVRIFQDFPEYYTLFSEKQFTYNGVTQKNYNTLLNYNSLGVDGIKTGHTHSGGFGMVASAARNGRRVFVAVNGLKTETERAYETKRLIQYAFDYFETKTVFTSETIIGEIPVRHKKITLMPVYVKEDVVVTYPKNLRSEIKAFISPKELDGSPVDKGQEVGILTIKIEGTKYSFPIYAGKTIHPSCRVCNYMRLLYKKLFSLVSSHLGKTME
ncbi:MAG: D-alanyl-D-alanine carboxypeptidase family protein [Aaplasma endosymbiont of Hyalomma asiaticum]